MDAVWVQRFKGMIGRIRTYPSVYFYTFHKCASVLFADYLLKNLKGLKHLDYLSQIYNGQGPGTLAFAKRGHVYGPLRLTAGWSPAPEGASGALAAAERLLDVVATETFVRDKSAVFLVRDPRDILVSTYYSFGFSHGFSPVPEIRARQEDDRIRIQRTTIDDYVAERAGHLLTKFELLIRLSRVCRRGVILRYEDMIDRWNHFVTDLTQVIAIEPVVLKGLYDQSRPRDVEDIAAHRRSGKPGGFRWKLKRETVATLDVAFRDVLERFGYEAAEGP